jgi:hypothetical protein
MELTNMKMTKILSFLFTLSLLSACGSFEDDKKSLMTPPEEKKDLVSAFDVSKDQADKYKAVETKPEEKKEAVVAGKTKKEKTKKGSAAKTAKAEEVKTEKKMAVAKGEDYPEDYPQLFKDYDVVSKPVFEKFKPVFFQGEQSIIAISYLGVTAGYITMTSKDIVKMGDKMAYHYFARFKSRDAYRYFYWLDDSIETFVEQSTFLPIKYSLIQREKKQNVDDLQLFDFKKHKVSTWYKRVKENANKDEHLDKYIPRYLQDSFAALQFVRGLPLHKGDKYDFPVSTRGDTWLLKIEVVGEEMITVNGQDLRAYRLKAETHFPGVLQKSGDINFWYAMDEGKRLVKFQAKVKLGSIYGDLVEYKPGVPVK